MIVNKHRWLATIRLTENFHARYLGLWFAISVPMRVVGNLSLVALIHLVFKDQCRLIFRARDDLNDLATGFNASLDAVRAGQGGR